MKVSSTAFAAILLISATAGASAGETVSGEKIQEMVSGNTIEGSMLASGAYSEFYSADGSIKADGYDGKWRVKDNAMCFQYGTDPENCWAVEVKNGEISWLKDGKSDGTGKAVKGNPRNY